MIFFTRSLFKDSPILVTVYYGNVSDYSTLGFSLAKFQFIIIPRP